MIIGSEVRYGPAFFDWSIAATRQARRSKGPRTALAVAMVAIGLVNSGEASSLLRSLSTVIEWAWLQPSGAAVSPRALDRDRLQRTNDDAYLEGLTKALDQN
jgi:hypothetical protein